MAKHVITPAWQTSRGPIVRASGCAAGVPVAGARVFGSTRQNLWVNPSGTNGGVTVTSNGDGSMTLSGTATSAASVSSADSYIIKPSTAYTLSMDAALTGASFVMTEYDAAGSQLAQHSVSSTSAASFTSSASVARCVMSLSVQSGQAVSRTVRVMLNEGSSAQPWCPPGLSSVSELGIVCAGKNLIGSTGYHGTTVAGVTATSGDDGSVTVSGTLSGNQAVSLGNLSIGNPLPPGTYTVSGGYENSLVYVQVNDGVGGLICNTINNPTNELSSAADKPYYFIGVKPGFSGSVTVYPQLELGSTATAYEPPAVSTTPIDLSGHQLRSLPDGTRDVLAVDGSGAVSVEQAVECVTYNGSSDETGSIYESQYGHFFHLKLPGNIGGDAPGADTGAILCDTLPVNKSDVANSKTGIWFLKDYRSAVYVKPPVDLTSFEDFRSWLAQHPVTVIYPVATPQTVHLGPITPPTVPASDATLWATSDVPCDLEATTWTASGAEQGRQQAAMVKVAQQVRQQAETVAALAAQSLEA